MLIQYMWSKRWSIYSNNTLLCLLMSSPWDLIPFQTGGVLDLNPDQTLCSPPLTFASESKLAGSAGMASSTVRVSTAMTPRGIPPSLPKKTKKTTKALSFTEHHVPWTTHHYLKHRQWECEISRWINKINQKTIDYVKTQSEFFKKSI